MIMEFQTPRSRSMSRSRDALNRGPRSRSLSRSRDALNQQRGSRHSLAAASQGSLDRAGRRISLGFVVEKMLEPEKMEHWLDRDGSRLEIILYLVYIWTHWSHFALTPRLHTGHGIEPWWLESMIR